MEAFNAVRSFLKSRDDWKINFCDLQERMYTGLFITESWLRSHIHDNVVAPSGFNLVQKDRVDIIHGGVCVYIRDNINFTIL